MVMPSTVKTKTTTASDARASRLPRDDQRCSNVAGEHRVSDFLCGPSVRAAPAAAGRCRPGAARDAGRHRSAGPVACLWGAVRARTQASLATRP
jgi:hypothetical protein